LQAVDHVEDLVQRLIERTVRVAAEGRVEHLGHFGQRLGRDGHHDRVLAVEVAVERPRRQVRHTQDVPRRGGVKTVDDEATPGRVEDLLASCVEVSLRYPRHGAQLKE
jgi:hypothetical protein